MRRIQGNDPTLRPISLGNPPACKLPMGCWLVAPRRGYTHHGIYVGDGQVVHYAGLARSWKRGPVEIVSLADFSFGRSLWMKPTTTARYVGLQAAQRALSRLGENRYRIVTNNCEHFCAWCLDGESRSGQVDQCLAWPRAAAFALVARLASMLTAVASVRPRLSPNHQTA
jgi:hypothetical protein